MLQNEITELPRLKNQNYENIFNIYTDEGGYYYYNLLQSVHFPQNLPNAFFENYTIQYEDTWPLIAYKQYNNITLWWLIALANNVINPLEPLNPGSTIRIPVQEVASNIITQIVIQQ